MIKELQEKLNNNLGQNFFEGKLDIIHIKEEINKLIEIYHKHKKNSLTLPRGDTITSE